MHRHHLLRLLMTAGLQGLVLLAPDDGAGSGDAGTGSDAGGNQGAGGDTAGSGKTDDATDTGQDDDAKKGTEKTFTQAELAEAVARERTKATKAAETKAAQDAERAKMDETERLKAEKDDAEKAADAKVAAADQRLILADVKTEALAQDVDPTIVAQFMKLVDTADIEVGDDGEVDAKAVKKAVADALKTVPMMKKGAASGAGAGASGGNMNAGATNKGAKTLEDAVSARIAS